MSFSVAELVASRDPPPVLKRIMLTMTPSPEKLMLTSIMLCPKVQVEVAQVVDGADALGGFCYKSVRLEGRIE